MKRFLILSLTAILMASCGGLKVASTSYAVISANSSSSEQDQYVFNFNKKAGDYIEIVEVKLLNTEKGMDESAPFQVTDGEKSILDVKGRDAFTVVASKPATAEKILATSALIVYRTEKDGEKQFYTVKKIGADTK